MPMPKLKGDVGDRFGTRVITLVLFKRRKDDGKIRQFWTMLCDCGRENTIPASDVIARRSGCLSCKTVMAAGKRNNALGAKIGDRFGSRVIVDEVVRRHKQGLRKLWRMRCDCGQEGTSAPNDVSKHGDGCRVCTGIRAKNRSHHPNLTEEQVQRIVDLNVFKRQTVRSLLGVYRKNRRTRIQYLTEARKPYAEAKGKS